MRRKVGIGLFLLTVGAIIIGYILTLSPRALHREGERARVAFYESWCKENEAAYNGWISLARENRWSMYVWARAWKADFAGIGRLGWGERSYALLYGSRHGRCLKAVTGFREGRAAFIECTQKVSWWRSDVELSEYKLGVLESDGTVSKVSFDASEPVRVIALGRRYVLLSESYQKVWLYDIRSNVLCAVLEGPPAQDGIEKAGILRDRFLLLMTGILARTIVVLDAEKPHVEISRIEKVADFLTLAEHVVVEKDEACFLYDPATGSAERLTSGRLLREAGSDGFLFYRSERGTLPLYRYDITARSAELLWEPPSRDPGFGVRPGEGKPYDYGEVILSPCGHFLLVPWRLEGPMSKAQRLLGTKLEYDVYDIRTGEKRGAFLNLYEGKFFFEFLGWDTSDQGVKPAAPGG